MRSPNPSTPISRFDLSELVEILRPRLRAVLARHTVPPQDAEDVLQEVFVAAWASRESILHLESWLLGALRLKCAMYWRRRRNERVQGVEASHLEELSAPVSPCQEQDMIRLDLASLTSQLETRQRAALFLRFGEGLTSREVAAQLGYSPTSIRKLTCRCLEKVQRRAEAEGFRPRA